MKVLVTGGAGFIGQHTVRALLERGDEVRVVDALTQPVHALGATFHIEGAECIRGDVRDKDSWGAWLSGVEAVAHLAAYQDYMPDFSTFFSVNAVGTALLYEVIVERRLDVGRVVVASSQSVYGEGAARCDTHGVLVPEQRTAEQLVRAAWDVTCPRCGGPVTPVPTPETFAEPRNAYGISKLAAETAALALGAQHGIPTAALRFAIVHGVGQSPRNAYSGLLRSVCLGLLAGRAPVVFEDGAQLRDYVAIDDVVAATLVALDHPGAPGAAYNVGGARSWSVLEVIDAVNRIVPEPQPPVLSGEYRVGDVRHTIGDLSRLRGLGWEPVTDLTRTWRAYWEWLASTGTSGVTVEQAYEEMRRRGVLRPAARSGGTV